MIRTIASVLLGMAILVLLGLRLDVGQVRHTLAEVNPQYLGPAIATLVIVIGIKAHRLACIIDHGMGVRPKKRLYAACFIGFACNAILPARLGDLARVVVLTRHNPVSAAACLCGSGVGHVLDLLVLTLGFVLAASITQEAPSVLRGFGWVGLTAGTAIVGFALLRRRIFQVIHGVQRAGAQCLTPAAVRHLTTFLGDLLRTGRVLRQPRVLFMLFGQTAVIWMLEVLIMDLGLRAFSVHQSLMVSALLVVIVNVLAAASLTPGNWGMHQLAAVLVLGRSGVDYHTAMAASFGIQTASSATLILFGVLLSARELFATPSFDGARDEHDYANPDAYCGDTACTRPLS